MRKGCILVVDDEHMLEEAYGMMLSGVGYDRICYCDAKDALDFLLKNHSKIDLALIDLTMPKVTGTEIAKQIAAIDADLPIIIMTGTLADNVDHNVRAVLQKPITMTELLEAVQKHMRPYPHKNCGLSGRRQRHKKLNHPSL